MKHVRDFFKKGATIPIVLTILAVISSLATITLLANPFGAIPQVDIRTEPQSGTLVVGDAFIVKVVVESSIAVNAFEGELLFDHTILEVERIDYNISIADLWVHEPWYSNGDGSIRFAGGTTKPGGFTGTDTLLTITFKSIGEGAGYVGIKEARILKHDGLGTDAIVKEPIDAIFTVEKQQDTTYDVLRKQSSYSTVVQVQKQKPTTDLNHDGKQTIADLSIFMLHLTKQDVHSDFNGDGKINLGDLSIILESE